MKKKAAYACPCCGRGYIASEVTPDKGILIHCEQCRSLFKLAVSQYWIARVGKFTKKIPSTYKRNRNEPFDLSFVS